MKRSLVACVAAASAAAVVIAVALREREPPPPRVRPPAAPPRDVEVPPRDVEGDVREPVVLQRPLEPPRAPSVATEAPAAPNEAAPRPAPSRKARVLPELIGERDFVAAPVAMASDVVEVAHTFTLEHRGRTPLSIRSARVTTSTVLERSEWPLVLAPGESVELVLVNKLRRGDAEKISRAWLVADGGAELELTLAAHPAR